MTTLQNETVVVREISHDSYCVDNYWSHGSFDNGRHEIEESDESWHVVSRKKNNSKFNQAQKRRNCQQRSLNKESNTSEAISANNTLTSSDLSSLRNKAKKGTKEKLPDRKLYSVREKQNKEKEKKEVVKEISGTNGLEDDKSYTSTGSTTFSERHKPTDEEINFSREEKKERTAFHEIDSPQPETSETPMFSICLERQGVCETIPIYEDEEDYESFLDKICQSHNLAEKVALPFKINLMRTIHQMHSNPAKVEPYLNELLSMNYQLIIAEYEDENENTNSISFCEPEDCFSGSNEDSN